MITANSLLLTTGFDIFEAERKEEYGYGIYENVITSVELEQVFKSGKPLLTAQGKTPHASDLYIVWDRAMKKPVIFIVPKYVVLLP